MRILYISYSELLMLLCKFRSSAYIHMHSLARIHATHGLHLCRYCDPLAQTHSYTAALTRMYVAVCISCCTDTQPNYAVSTVRITSFYFLAGFLHCLKGHA